MACAVSPCQSASQSNVPPCHQHHRPANQAPPTCSHPVMMTQAGHSSPTVIAGPDFIEALFLPLAASSLLRYTVGEPATFCTTSPPGLTALSTVILRI